MKGPKSWTRWRRRVQGAVALFYLFLPLVNREGLRQVTGNLASLKLGPVDLVEPAMGWSAALASRLLPWALALGLLVPLAVALALGPVFCSWLCPWGFFSEGLDQLKVRFLKVRRSWTAEGFRKLLWLRLGAVLFFFLASWAFVVPAVAVLAPPRLLTALPQELFYLRVPPLFTGSLLLFWLVLEFLTPRRLVCRALCPVGGVWSFLRTPWSLRVEYEPSLCLDPKVAPCHLHCPWGIDPRTMGLFHGCTNCLRCVEGCPSAALQVHFGHRPARGKLLSRLPSR